MAKKAKSKARLGRREAQQEREQRGVGGRQPGEGCRLLGKPDQAVGLRAQPRQIRRGPAHRLPWQGRLREYEFWASRAGHGTGDFASNPRVDTRGSPGRLS